MKLSTMLRSALALGLGFAVGIASAEDTPLYGVTFAGQPSAVAPLNDYAYADGVAISNNYCDAVNGKGWFVESLENDTSFVTNEVLKLNTESGTLTNKLDAAVAADINAGIAADGSYFEFDAKFVASDTLDAGVAGGTDATKLAVYAFNSGEEGEETKVVVFHAYYDSEFNMLYTNDVTDITVSTEEFTKVRIDMTQVNDEGLMLNAFTVKIGDQLVTTDTAYDPVAGSAAGSLFLTAEKWSVTENQTVSSLNFKGTGEIDNIAVGTVTGGPVPPPPPAASVILISGTTETGYADLASAFAAAQEGDTIKLLQNIGLTNELDIVDFNGTLDLNGFELSNDENWVANGFDWLIDFYVSDASKTSSMTITNGTVTLKDGHMFYVCAGATLTVAAETTINEIAASGCANPFRTYGKVGGHTGESSAIPCTVNVYGSVIRDEVAGNSAGWESGAIDQCLGASVVNVYDGAVVTHVSGRLFKMSGGTNPTVNVYGGTLTAGGNGNMFHAYAAEDTVHIEGGQFTMGTLFSSSGAGKTFNVSGLGADCSAMFCTTNSQIESLAYFCDEGYEPVLENDWYVIKKAAGAPLAILIASGADPVEYTDLHEALVDGSVAGSVVELIADVDLAGINWVPVTDFLGKFDGKGHKISNLTVDVEGGYAGLFGSFAWGKNHAGICNLTLSNVTVSATSSYVGALAAMNGTSGGGAISNVTVCGSISVSGTSYVGAIVGHNQYNDIIDCHVIGDGVSTSIIGSDATGQVGGLVGMSAEGNQQIWNCSVENISVKGTGLVGGLWGRMHYGNHLVGSTVSNVDVYCAADVETAEVKIGTLVGGFVGGNPIASVMNCTASNVNLFTLDGTPVATRWTGTVADGKNVALGTGVEGDAFAFNFSKPKLTAGTFEVKNADALTAITGWCAEGYAPVKQGDVYVIMVPPPPTVILISGTTETPYATIADAVAVAQAGDTVKLLTNAVVDVSVTNTVAIELDLNDFAITRATGAVDSMFVAEADLKVYGGSIDGCGLRALYVGAGDVVLDDIEITSAYNTFIGIDGGSLTIGTNAVLTANNDIISAGGGVVNVYGQVIRGSGERPATWFSGTSVLNVYEGAVMSSAGADVIRSNGGTPAINVYGGALTATGGYPVFYSYKDCAAVYTIFDGEISAGSGQCIFQIVGSGLSTVTPFGADCKAKFKSLVKGWNTVTLDAYLAPNCEFEQVEGWYVVKAVAAAHDIDLGDGLYIDGIAGTGDVPHTIQFTSIDLAAAKLGIQAGEIVTAEGGSLCTVQAVEALDVVGSEAISLAAKVEADADDATKGIITITDDISGYDTLFFVGIGPAAADGE